MLLLLMFSTDPEDGRREAFFGALMFESTEQPDGTTSVVTGVENLVPLIVLFVVLAVVLGFIQVTYRTLKQYREHLLEERGLS
jgi:hypothetical protein